MRSAGFTLIELVIVIVVLAIGVVAIGSAFAYMARSLSVNEDLQYSWQIAHECAEHILGQARAPRGHFTAVAAGAGSAICNGMAVAGYTRVVNVTNMPTGGALCSAGWACKRVEILVTKGSMTTSLNFMLVQY
jgi:prepilin-type N-terminal cleavage/methylation domain-containing protein